MNTITWNWLWFALLFVAGGYLLSRLRDPTGGGSNLAKDDTPPPSPRDGGGRDAPVAPRHRSPSPVIDPVTRESVCMATAPAFFYQARVYFFASVRSRERFEASPRAYLPFHKPGPENPDPTFDGAGCAQSARAQGLYRRDAYPWRWHRSPGFAAIPESQAARCPRWSMTRRLKKEVVRRREEITRTILAEARKVMPQYCIELVDVRIKRLDYVESVREKVYARMISERKRIAAQFRSEGEGRSAEILGTMEKELRQIRSTAYRRVQEVRGKADAEATRVYGAAYGGDPEFYAFSRTLEAYKEGQNKNQTVIPTTDSDYYRYLKRSGAQPATGSAR